jgi:TonB family protein
MIARVWLTVVKRRIALGVLGVGGAAALVFAARTFEVRSFTEEAGAEPARVADFAVRPEPGMQPVFTPFTVEPKLNNQPEVLRALQRYYPPLLRDAGIGGRVVMWFYIDETGRVLKTQLHESSGYEALDLAAQRVAETLRFTPGKNRDKAVPVWVQLPIAFTSK